MAHNQEYTFPENMFDSNAQFTTYTPSSTHSESFFEPLRQQTYENHGQNISQPEYPMHVTGTTFHYTPTRSFVAHSPPRQEVLMQPIQHSTYLGTPHTPVPTRPRPCPTGPWLMRSTGINQTSPFVHPLPVQATIQAQAIPAPSEAVSDGKTAEKSKPQAGGKENIKEAGPGKKKKTKGTGSRTGAAIRRTA